MKSMNEEMDILDEDWELLPDEGFLEIQNDGGKSIFSRRYSSNKSTTTDVQMNYFIYPPPKSTLQFIEKTGPVSVPSVPKHGEELVKKQEFEKNPTQIKITPQIDQDPVSQVFFKKMKEDEFVDMKLDSPKFNSSSNINNNNKGIEVGFQFEKKGEQQEQPGGDDDSDMVMMKTNYESDEDDDGGLNLWKWSLSGIGAIFSFGMAAATTVCIIILSNSSHGSKNKHYPHQNQKQLQLQIFTNEKGIKQVIHHAGKISEAISAVRGVPVSRANITFGGYYDAAM